MGLFFHSHRPIRLKSHDQIRSVICLSEGVILLINPGQDPGSLNALPETEQGNYPGHASPLSNQ